MSSSKIDLVINTGPIIALAAGISQPDVVLRHFRRVLVPREVAREIRAGGIGAFGGNILDFGGPIGISESDVNVRKDLVLALDRGEAIDISSTMNMMRAKGERCRSGLIRERALSKRFHDMPRLRNRWHRRDTFINETWR